jgi:hypothetical protein
MKNLRAKKSRGKAAAAGALCPRVTKDNFLGLRVTSNFKRFLQDQAWKEQLSIANFIEVHLSKDRVKVSPDSAFFLRLSAVESKLDRVLLCLEDRQTGSRIDPVTIQDAIRAHIMGDRGTIDALERSRETQENASITLLSNTVGTSTGVDKKTVQENPLNA